MKLFSAALHQGETVSNSHNFKIGDKVRCIDAKHSFGNLTEGGIYDVTEAYDGTPVVKVPGSGYFDLARFEPLT